MDQRRPNIGGNRGPRFMSESLSFLFQKTEIPNTQERTSHEQFCLRGPLWKSYVDKFTQPHANTKDQTQKKLETQRYAPKFGHTKTPCQIWGQYTRENS